MQFSGTLIQADFTVSIKEELGPTCRAVTSEAPGGGTDPPELTRGRLHNKQLLGHRIQKALSADGCTRLMLTQRVNVFISQTFTHSRGLTELNTC